MLWHWLLSNRRHFSLQWSCLTFPLLVLFPEFANCCKNLREWLKWCEHWRNDVSCVIADVVLWQWKEGCLAYEKPAHVIHKVIWGPNPNLEQRRKFWRPFWQRCMWSSSFLWSMSDESSKCWSLFCSADLANGGCISAFKWNGGAEYKGKPWNESLPTDSAVCSCVVVVV